MASRTDLNAKGLTRLALLAALALLLSYLEGLLPPLIAGLPVKLGLANVAVLIALELFGAKQAALIQLVRCALGPLIGGSPVGALYSLAGGALSLLAMCALHALKRRRPNAVSLIGVSVAGAFLHSLGQLLMGAALVSPAVFAYFTPMELLSVPAGLFVGLLAMLAIRVEKVVS